MSTYTYRNTWSRIVSVGPGLHVEARTAQLMAQGVVIGLAWGR